MLRVEALEAGYGAGKVLFGVDFVAPLACLTAIIGRNGVGKTTALKTIMGFIRPISGRVLLDEKDLVGLDVHEICRAGIGYVPEGRQVFPRLTVAENLRVGQRRESKLWPEERILDLFPNLAERFHNEGRTLSGGEQQMLAIARALVTEPKLVLLDEPSQGLAPKILQQLADTLRRLCTEGVTILLVEQNLNLTEQVAEHVLVMSKGRIVEAFDAARFKREEQSVRHKWLTL
jgi:branched-chain amino acid transport system ATP-binding protein